MATVKFLCANQIGAQALPDLDLLKRPPTTIFHVSPSGDDSNMGTLEQPWKTIKKAAATLTNGQGAYVHDGIYREERIMTGHPGLEDAPIWLIGASRAKVIITGDPSHVGAREAPFFVINQPCWVIQGFEIDAKGQQGHGIRIQSTTSVPNAPNTHRVVVRDVHIHHGSGPAAVSLANVEDVAVLDSEIHDYIWQGHDSHGVMVQGGVKRVLIKGNHSYNNGGDSVQCVGVRADVVPDPNDPADITIEDNRYHSNHENAVDLKSCQRVTVRNNKCYDFHPVATSPQGTALVVHYSAREVLIEQNRIWNSTTAANIGSKAGELGSVVLRRNLIFDLKAEGEAPGDGIVVALMSRPNSATEIHHNTFYNIPRYAIRLGVEGSIPQSIVFNNIIMNTQVAIDLVTVNAHLTSDFNVFWNDPAPDGVARPVKFRPTEGEKTFDQWQKLNQDANSKNQDPLFNNDPINNDFFTQPNSPARDAAAALNLDIGALESCP